MYRPKSHFTRKIAFALGTALAVYGALAAAQVADANLNSERRGIGLVPIPAAGGAPGPGVAIDPRRALAVTDWIVTSRFSFQETLDAIWRRGGGTGLSAPLFWQWWDTQNRGPSLGMGPHCDDQMIGGRTVFNGFDYECPRGEGQQAFTDPFANSPSGYIALGLFNRFDLAATNGSDCGEYRIVFGRRSGVQQRDNRNFIIFEGVLPNPHPSKGIHGCVRVAEFWRDVNNDNDAISRANRLRNFYLNGLPGIQPVFHPDSYGASSSGRGQIRTNQFMVASSGGFWMAREFKLARSCSSVQCVVKANPATVKTNPSATLFDANTALGQAFRNDFVNNQVARLAVPDINLFDFAASNRFNTGQSVEQGIENDYLFTFSRAPGGFTSAIQSKLTALGSSLTPNQIIARAQALSCAGCHSLSVGSDIGAGQQWPFTLGFVHIAEDQFDRGPNGPRFLISPALTDVFLPHRKRVLENYLQTTRNLRRCLQPCNSYGYAQSCWEICY